MVLLGTMMLPPQVTMVSTFVGWTQLRNFTGVDWVDTFKPLIIPSFLGGSAMLIFLMRQFFKTLPVEYEESARVDGASRLRVLIRIVLPLATPALSTLAALTFLDSWNNFLWPLIAVTSTNRMTLPLGLATFQGAHATEWTLLMAGSVMSLIPMLIVFFAAQRYFVRSVAATGLTGD